MKIYSTVQCPTSPSVQSSIMIQTGFSVMTPISLTMWGWSNWRMVTTGEEQEGCKGQFAGFSVLKRVNNWGTHKRGTYMLLGETFLWHCLTLSSYTSSLPQTGLGSPAGNRSKQKSIHIQHIQLLWCEFKFSSFFLVYLQNDVAARVWERTKTKVASKRTRWTTCMYLDVCIIFAMCHPLHVKDHL